MVSIELGDSVTCSVNLGCEPVYGVLYLAFPRLSFPLGMVPMQTLCCCLRLVLPSWLAPDVRDPAIPRRHVSLCSVLQVQPAVLSPSTCELWLNPRAPPAPDSLTAAAPLPLGICSEPSEPVAQGKRAGDVIR